MKKLLFSTILCLLFCFFVGSVMAQSSATSTATPTGSGSWTVPAGVWKITKLEAYGAGGGGGNATTAYSVGAGGGSGAYASTATNISVVPGSEVLNYSVGAAGSGGSAGGTSYVRESASSSSYYVRATGGGAGQTVTRGGRNSTQTATAGTAGTANYGTTKQAGNAGNSGSIYRPLTALGNHSGTGGAGGNNVNNTGAGSSRTSSGAGNSTTTVGAGGGGALNITSSSQSTYTGGQGGPGRVIITYEILTLHVTIDANGGTTSATDFDILYYNQFGSNLPDATLDGYTFLGWYTDGGVKMTADSLCKETADFTLKAHFMKSGAIADGSTTASPCQNFTVYNDETPDTRGDAFTYSWSYTVNGGTPVELNVDKYQLTQEDLTLNQMGTYVFTRYVNVLGQKVASAGNYTINVASVEPGEIASGSKYICTTGAFSIGSTTDASTTSTGTIVYEWRYSKDGGSETIVASSDKKELTQADVTLTESGTYVFKRYATLGCAEPVAATGEYTLYVTKLAANYAAPTYNFNELCVGGEVEVTGADYNLTGVTSPHNIPTDFNWMISKDAGTPEIAGQNATLTQVLNSTGNYSIYASVVYFNDNACVVNTEPVAITVVEDPTIAVPTLSATEVCPNGAVTLTAATPAGGVGGEFTYNWEFKADGSSTWNAVSASEATYDQYTGTTVTASNFTSMGAVQYRSYVSNPRGCDAYSDAVDLTVTIVDVPVVRGDTLVCPEAGKTIAFKATKTDDNFQLYWYENENTDVYSTTIPLVSMDNELDTTNYVAQYNPGNGCVSARVPDAIYISYSAHLQYVDASGDLDQTVCQNDGIVDIQFNHGGDCEPQITWSPAMPAGLTIDNSVAGETRITGTPTEAGDFSYHVALLPEGNTRCAAPNYYDGSLTVNPLYEVTENKTICGGGYTISDKMGHSYTFTESGTYTKTLEAVTGCDSVVTLNLYVHEWNQFGFEDGEELIAGWTSFNSVSSPINADVAGSVSGSQITYSGWNGSNENHGNNEPTILGEGVDITNISPSYSDLITASGHLLALRNHQGNGTNGGINNGKSIVIRTSTVGYGNLKMKFDYGSQRPKSFGQWSGNDKAFTIVRMYYSTDGSHYEALSTINVDQEEEFVTYGVCDVNLTTQSLGALENANNIYLKFEFDGAASTSNNFYNFFLIDNLCISGEKIKELELTGQTEACTNQPLTVVATAPYINTNVTPNDTTPVVYKWERIVGGASTVLEETSHVLVDNDVQAGDYKYVVSVGSAPCGQSDTIDVFGIVPAYRLDIVRHGYVCSNEVDQVSNITFTDDCKYVDGMFIVTPTADEMRTPGTYNCQLSIPTTTNPCDSVITLMLEVKKAFDTTVVAHICLGETYTEYGFNITPTIEGVSYHTSPDAWKCASGCDSVYHLTLMTNSVQQALTSESDVIMAAWPMDNGVSNYTPACGVKTVGSTFVVEGSTNVPPFANVAGHTPSSDYCYTSSSTNGALTWPNLSSSCSGFTVSASYTDYSGAYFEIKLNPYDYENLRLKFDYKRENASTSNAQAFNQVRYSYKFSETGSYTTIGIANITSTDWASQTLDFSSANTLDNDVVFLKLEFIGGNVGGTQSCGTFSGSKYLPSYITVDNVMIWGDRPARASLDGTAQTCDKTYVCEGEEVTFTCQGDDTYFKFYVVDETTTDETPFAGATSISITPTQSTSYIIKAVEQTTMCDSIWGPFNVEVVKNPALTLTSGSLDAGLCGNETLDVEFSIENATSYNFTWLTEGNVMPKGIIYNDDNNGVVSIGGTLTDGGSARYLITAEPDSRCSAATLSQIGTIAVRLQPQIVQTIGEDSVCQGAAMQFVVDTAGLNFTLVPEDQRFHWFTANGTLGIQDTLSYTADEATHSIRHYIQVKQNGCTTLDSLDIVVLDLSADTLRTEDMTYTFNYGDNYLSEDSLIVPDLMHNGELVPANYIASVEHTGGSKIFPTSMDDMDVVITWTITDKCGNVHTKNQTLHFILPPCGGDMTVTDKDGNVYNTVRMGLNCWMKENLKVTQYEDETRVPEARGYMGGNYTDTTANILTFGRLYTWYSAVKVPENSAASVTPQVDGKGYIQGVCPDGWRLPDRECFASLSEVEMNKMRKPGSEYWLDGGGTNETQFSLVGAGFYNNATNRCENILGNSYFMTTDVYGDTQVKCFEADCHCYRWQEIYQDKGTGFSVRCVKE
jgi:uncharacterized protein (TIGR02145 family)/uncharacterized repeat protein (TIGR02543 family)